MKHVLISLLIILPTAITADEAQATIFDLMRADLERRREIRSMEITERPDRIVHVYGNTVRWRHRQGRSFLYGD